MRHRGAQLWRDSVQSGEKTGRGEQTGEREWVVGSRLYCEQHMESVGKRAEMVGERGLLSYSEGLLGRKLRSGLRSVIESRARISVYVAISQLGSLLVAEVLISPPLLCALCHLWLSSLLHTTLFFPLLLTS